MKGEVESVGFEAAEEEWAERYRAFWRVSIKLRPVLQSVDR